MSSRQSYYNTHLYNFAAKKSSRSDINASRYAFSRSMSSKDSSQITSDNQKVVTSINVIGDEIVDCGLHDDEYEESTPQLLERSSLSVIQNAETQISGKINNLVHTLQFKKRDSDRKKMFRQSSKEGKAFLWHLEKINSSPEKLRQNILHAPSAEPIVNHNEKMRYAKKPKERDLLKDYMEKKKQATLKEGYDTNTSPKSVNSVKQRVIVDPRFVRPVEADTVKTTVQEVINGVPHGYTSNSRRAMAEAKHLARHNPEHMLHNYKMLQKEYEEQVATADTEENNLIELYREEQIHKELLISTLEGEIQMIESNTNYIQEVQNILDACAFRENIFLRGLKAGKSGDNGRYQFLEQLLQEEQTDTLNLSNILDKIKGLKNPSIDNIGSNPTGNHSVSKIGNGSNHNNNVSVSKSDNNVAAKSAGIKRHGKERRKSKFMEFREWHKMRSPVTKNTSKSSSAKKNRRNTMAEIQYKEASKNNRNNNKKAHTKISMQQYQNDEDESLMNQLSNQIQHVQSDFKNRNTIMVRISKAIEKLTRLMEHQSGREIILTNAHCLPALATILEKLNERDTFTSNRRERGNQNYKKFDAIYKSKDIIDRCLQIIAWQDVKIKNRSLKANDVASYSSKSEEYDNDFKLLQRQWDLLEKMRNE